MAANRRACQAARAFAPRGEVAAGRVVAGKAEAHGHDGDAALVVELLGRKLQPGAQPIAGRIGEGRAGGVHAHAWRLARDADARGRARAQHRARLVRQLAALRGRRGRCGSRGSRQPDGPARGRLRATPAPAQTSSTRPSSARTTRGSFTSPRRASIGVGHVREQDAPGADAVELGGNRASSSCGSAARPRTGSIP